MVLLGRWGSQAILRYIQDSPLQELIDVEADIDAKERGEPSASLEPELKKLKTEQKLVRDEVYQCDQLAAEVSELNKTPPYVIGKRAHRPDARGKELPPMHWSTKCGWKYGCSKFTRSAAAYSLCRKCFRDEGTDLVSIRRGKLSPPHLVAPASRKKTAVAASAQISLTTLPV